MPGRGSAHRSMTSMSTRSGTRPAMQAVVAELLLRADGDHLRVTEDRPEVVGERLLLEVIIFYDDEVEHDSSSNQR